MKSISLATLRECASQVGLSVVAVTSAESLELDRERLESWQRSGYAGDMAFMNRDSSLLSSPRQVLPGARSVVSVGAYYDRTPREPLLPGYGRVARYAWGRDYHKVLRKALEALCGLIASRLGSTPQYRVFADSVPLLERAIAGRAGMGFIGKNTMLILPRVGSFLFLGEVLWDLEILDVDSPPAGGVSRCGSCARCLTECPSKAFVSDRILDARRCISYLTIEKRDSLSWEERGWLGEWIFGCDVCQDVCPFNARSLKLGSRPDRDEFSSDNGVGQALSLREVLAIDTDREFISRFGGTPVTRAKRAGLLRNAAVVAANTRALPLMDDLRRVAQQDVSSMVRQHAVWAYCVLAGIDGGHKSGVSAVLEKARKDSAIEVTHEAEACYDRLF